MDENAKEMYYRMIGYTNDLDFLSSLEIAINNDSNVESYRMGLLSRVNYFRQRLMQGVVSDHD